MAQLFLKLHHHLKVHAFRTVQIDHFSKTRALLKTYFSSNSKLNQPQPDGK